MTLFDPVAASFHYIGDGITTLFCGHASLVGANQRPGPYLCAIVKVVFPVSPPNPPANLI
jgi:hypothetical protein